MKFIILLILMLLLSGCTSGRFSANEGTAKFSIPFDFSTPQKQDSREKKIIEEMDRLQQEMEQKEAANE